MVPAGVNMTAQQPGGDTPGVAAAPVALAGAIVPGIARFIVMLSAHADVFGVGITAIVESMLVAPSCATSCGTVPGGGLAATSGVESGKAAPLVGGPPGIELHTVVEGVPSGAVGGTFPVVVTTIGVGMVPNGAAGVIVDVETGLSAVDGVGTGSAVMGGDGGICMTGRNCTGIAVTEATGTALTMLPFVEVEEVAGIVVVAGAGTIAGVVSVVSAIDDREVTGTAGVPGVICPVGVEQVTTVPGIVGSEASGTGASVVSGAPGWVVAENGLGPLSGEVMIVAGVDESPMAVVPMVETCARPAWGFNSRAVAMNSKRRIVIDSSRRSSLSLACAP
jgi:hypothetical protein